MVNLIFLGAPGSGKGTYASRISAHFKTPAISTGEILRQAVRSGSDLGNRVKSFMESGKLVPDEVMADVLEERICQDDCREGFILDGYPRTLPQAENLALVLGKRGVRITCAIAIDLAEEIIVKRLSGRRSCSGCGEVYNIYTMPPKVEGKCDKCSGPLVMRPDDQPETIRKRLQVYREQSEPLVAYYEKRGLLRTVSGNAAVEEVVGRIVDMVKREC